MNSPAIPQGTPRSRSQAGGRRPTSRTSVDPPSHHFSDCPTEPELPGEGSPGLGQRSLSLTTLQPTVIQPRMAQLETLEAKMASIEVSLSSTPRRKKNGSLSGVSLGSSIRNIPKELAAKELENLRNALRDKENIIQSLKGQLTVPGLRLGGIRNNMNNSNNSLNNRELTEVEKKQAEDRLNRIKTDIDNKRLAIKNLKMALERLDITDNIDVRIQQAELEYQLGREELNLLTLLEESRALQLCIDESNKTSSVSHTLYSCIDGDQCIILQAIEVEYDIKSPKFGAGQRDSTVGLWIDWALEETGLCKGDRLIEVNGKIVLTKSREDLIRLLSAAPDPAQIVVLRKVSENIAKEALKSEANKEVAALRSELDMVRERAEEAQRAKDGLRTDNIRLTHRISYLEEQVSELLNRKPEGDIRIVTPTPVISTVKTKQNVTNINITSHPNSSPSNSSGDVQVFQKGPQITTLVSKDESRESHISLPIRSKSSLSNVSSTHISAPSPLPNEYHCHKNHKHKHRSSRNGLQPSLSNQALDHNDKITYRKHNHHHHHRERDYSSETNSAVEHVARYNKRNSENNFRSDKDKDFGADVMDQSFKKATKIVHDLTRNKDMNLYEKHRQKCITASEKYNGDLLKHYNARKSTSVLDFRSEVHIYPKYHESRSVEDLEAEDIKSHSRIYRKIQDCRSVKSLDFDSDCNSTTVSSRVNGPTSKSLDYTSEPIENNRKLSYYQSYGDKPRPTPPKKPLRLSLHKTQSLQSVETAPPGLNTGNVNQDSRKSLKRNYRGEVPMSVSIKSTDSNGDIHGQYKEQQLKWNNFKKGIENSVDVGSWC